MANVYCDMSLATGSNDGTSWANAYQALATALNGTNVVGGDILYVKGTENLGSVDVTLNFGGTVGNPSIVLGCKSTTTNEPPVQSDLTPGWATGETRTFANKAHEDGDIPTVTVAGAATNDIFLSGWGYVYALAFINQDGQIRSTGTTPTFIKFEECHIEWGTNLFSSGDGGPRDFYYLCYNCQLHPRAASSQIGNGTDGVIVDLIGCATSSGATNTVGLFAADNFSGAVRVIGCDFSDAAHAICSVGTSRQSCSIVFMNNQLNASSSLTTGTIGGHIEFDFHQTVNVTGKSSGTILNVDLVRSEGNITEETTAVRTGGANDGSSSHSLAFTPAVNGTRDQYLGLVGPWMAFKITGDGTSQTVSVFIANSGAGDYNDDDVWLQVVYPSEGGTAQYDYSTTQMNLLGTPAAVTDDVISTWGSGGNNPQKLSASIAPDYVGDAYCRVVFAKNFSSSPETLYVDPLPVVS